MTLMLAACNNSGVRQTATCPQERLTDLAPAYIASLNNPLSVNADNLSAGKKLYESRAEPVACIECHGKRGDGNGRMAHMFEPSPRNFTCSELVDNIPDGQYYWIIKNGSIGTSMPAFKNLSDEQVWQLTLYLRHFSKDEG